MRHAALALSALWLAPALARAVDGVIEINHEKAIAGDPSSLDPPDYPILLRAPGSYQLTSDLAVPAGKDGIIVQAPGVTIDLHGFGVRGSEGCDPGACSPSLSGSGVLGLDIFGGGTPTVRNGRVSGFGASCIDLGGGRVEDVEVSSCGEHGIHMRAGAGIPGMVFGCHVSNTAASSIVLEAGGLYRDNVMRDAGLKSASPTIVGGTATGGNLCDDGRCSSAPTQRTVHRRSPPVIRASTWRRAGS
jgi:hypothetical protein